MNGIVSSAPSIPAPGAVLSTDFSFSVALELIKQGYKVARWGFKGHKKYIWLCMPLNGNLTYLEMVYPIDSTSPFAGKSVPWQPSRCDLLENDWYLYD